MHNMSSIFVFGHILYKATTTLYVTYTTRHGSQRFQLFSQYF